MNTFSSLLRQIVNLRNQETQTEPTAKQGTTGWKVIVTTPDSSTHTTEYGTKEEAFEDFAKFISESAEDGLECTEMVSMRTTFKAFFADGTEALLTKVHIYEADF